MAASSTPLRASARSRSCSADALCSQAHTRLRVPMIVLSSLRHLHVLHPMFLYQVDSYIFTSRLYFQKSRRIHKFQRIGDEVKCCCFQRCNFCECHYCRFQVFWELYCLISFQAIRAGVSAGALRLISALVHVHVCVPNIRLYTLACENNIGNFQTERQYWVIDKHTM